jgi:ATP phosphoribosyltransferase regulatory subunit
MRFGKAAPAERKQRIFAPADDDAALEEMIAELRGQGRVVIRHLPGQQGDAAAMGCDAVLVCKDGEWRIQDI